MTWNQAPGNWIRFKGRAKEKWGGSTDDETEPIAGNREILLGQIQKKYMIAREKAEMRIKDWKKLLG